MDNVRVWLEVFWLAIVVSVGTWLIGVVDSLSCYPCAAPSWHDFMLIWWGGAFTKAMHDLVKAVKRAFLKRRGVPR